MKPDPSHDSFIERCKRICGSSNEQCIIDTPSQMACIADMVVNKTFGISLMLKHAMETESQDEVKDYIGLALSNSSELSNWVKYLQVASDLRDLRALNAGAGSDQRREMRFPLPEGCQQYITLQARDAGGPFEMALRNFSQSGFQARSPRPFTHDEPLYCTLCLAHKNAARVQLGARVKYCEPDGEGYVIGAAIEDVSDNSDFNFFNNVFSLITELVGKPECKL